MKKMMIGAAVAAMGLFGAVAGVCDAGYECPFAYKVKVVMQTTESRKAGSGEDATCLRVRKMRRLVGYVYGETAKETVENACTCQPVSFCGCNAWDGAKLVLWDADTGSKYAVTDAKISILDKIGTVDNDAVEISFTVDGLTFSGQGVAATRDGSWTLKRASGCCAGSIAAGKCANCRECGDVVESVGWKLCGDGEATGETAAYGRWAMKWNDSACRRLRDGKSLEVLGGGWEDGEPVDFAL